MTNPDHRFHAKVSLVCSCGIITHIEALLFSHIFTTSVIAYIRIVVATLAS